MTDSPRHTATNLTNTELRALCRRYNISPKGGLSRAGRPDLLGWVQVNRLLERDAERARGGQR